MKQLFLMLLVCGSLQAQDATPAVAVPRPPKQTYSVTRAASPIRVDGVLDEVAWQSASQIPVRFEWLPGDNIAPPVTTDVRIAFDDQAFYIAFRAHDPSPSQIRAHLTDRDIPFHDDTVGFWLDPFNDQRRAFQFRINPLGVQMDSTFSDVDGSEDWSWDAIWESAGRIDNEGYTVEVAIPFTSLRFPNTSGIQTWGFMATRDYPRSQRHRMQSSYRDRNANCVVCSLEEVSGFENIRSGLNIELQPTVTARRTEVRHDFPDGGLEAEDSEIEPGLTARWSPTPNITINGAVNPDFSQVEADVAQLAVNERFALFFPEKRPFFLEGADLFSTPINAVHTRSVASPRWGLKVSGKQDRSAGGAFVAQDSVNTFIIPSFEGSSTESLDQDVLSSVLRYRFDLGSSSTVGVLLTSREGDEYHNRVGGLDGTLRVSRSDTVRFQYLRTSTAYPDVVADRQEQTRGSFDGDAVLLRYNHGSRNWFWTAQYRTLDPQFRADSGFITRVDTRMVSGGGERTIWGKPGGWYSRLLFGAFHDRTENYEGTAKEHGSDLLFTWFGARQAMYQLNIAPNREYFRDTHYDNLRINHYFEIRPHGDIAVFLRATTGKTIDVVNRQQADLLRLEPSLEFSLARRLNGSLSHGFQRLDVPRGRLFDAGLTEARLVYHFNIRTFARAILQYTDVRRNVAAYDIPVRPRSKQLFSQFLFSYKVNPQTVLLVGYSDNAVGFDDVQRSIDLTKTDRTVFLKVGYAWLF